MKHFLFLLFFFFLRNILFAAPEPSYTEKYLNSSVAYYQSRNEKNKNLEQQGRYSEADYILDLSKEHHKIPLLSQEKHAQLNAELQYLNSLRNISSGKSYGRFMAVLYPAFPEGDVERKVTLDSIVTFINNFNSRLDDRDSLILFNINYLIANDASNTSLIPSLSSGSALSFWTSDYKSTIAEGNLLACAECNTLEGLLAKEFEVVRVQLEKESTSTQLAPGIVLTENTTFVSYYGTAITLPKGAEVYYCCWLEDDYENYYLHSFKLNGKLYQWMVTFSSGLTSGYYPQGKSAYDLKPYEIYPSGYESIQPRTGITEVTVVDQTPIALYDYKEKVFKTKTTLTLRKVRLNNPCYFNNGDPLKKAMAERLNFTTLSSSKSQPFSVICGKSTTTTTSTPVVTTVIKSPTISEGEEKELKGYLEQMEKELGVDIEFRIEYVNTDGSGKKEVVVVEGPETAEAPENADVVITIHLKRNSKGLEEGYEMDWDWPSALNPCVEKKIDDDYEKFKASKLCKAFEGQPLVLAWALKGTWLLSKTIFSEIYCATSEDASVGYSNGGKFLCGAVNVFASNFDVFEILEGTISLVEMGFTKYMEAYSKYYNNINQVWTNIKAGKQFTESEAFDQLLLLLPPEALLAREAFTEGKKIAEMLWKFYLVEGNYWRYGQLTVIVVPMVVSAGTWMAVKGGVLMARISTIGKKAMEVSELVADAVKRGRKTTNTGNGKMVIEGNAVDPTPTIIEKQGEEVIIRKGLLADLLYGETKELYDQLIKLRLVPEEAGETIILRHPTSKVTVATFDYKNNKFTAVKWSSPYLLRNGFTKIETSSGYWILHKEGEIYIDLGFKDTRNLTAEEVNDYLVNGKGKDKDGQPYLLGTQVGEEGLQINRIIYFIEDYNGGNPRPGQFGSNAPIFTIDELRQKLAVKDAWKPTVKEPTLRAYRVIQVLPVRSGTIGSQIENNINLVGGGHQYELIHYLGKNWNEFLEPVGDRKGIKLK